MAYFWLTLHSLGIERTTSGPKVFLSINRQGAGSFRWLLFPDEFLGLVQRLGSRLDGLIFLLRVNRAFVVHARHSPISDGAKEA